MSIPALRCLKTVTLLMVFVCSNSVGSQDDRPRQKEAKSDNKQLTFKVPVDVVVVSATVTDKEGKPVTDLTAPDFKVYEDGNLQAIHTFARESYKTMQTEDAAGQKSGAKNAAAATQSVTRPRMISLMVDDLTASSTERQYAATLAIRKFVEEDMEPGDQVAILSGSGSVQHPFTKDRQILLAETGALDQTLNKSAIARSTCPVLSDLQAYRIYAHQNDGIAGSMEIAIQETMDCLHLDPSKVPDAPQIAEAHARGAALRQIQETQYRARTMIRALRQYVRSLKHFDASKTVILLSEGFQFQELNYDLQDAVDQALRSGVVINAVDLRGLYADPALAGDALSHATAQFAEQKQSLLLESARAQEDPLNELAKDTGGIFYHNNNDLHGGLQEISNRQACYYILTYASSTQKSDGRYHTIKLEVSRPGLELSYRKGYYSPKEELTFERRKKEDILNALQGPGNLNEIPVGFSYNYYQLEEARYEVAIVAHVGIRGVRFLDEESRHKNLFSLAVAVFDENDRYVDGLERSIDFNLAETSYSSLLSRGFASKVDFRLPIGRYKIKVVVRESVLGKMGSLTKTIEIP